MNGVTKITSYPDIMMITFTDADPVSALPEALTAFGENNICVDMICRSAPRGTTIDFSFTMDASYLSEAMQTIASYRSGNDTVPLVSSGYSKINLFGEEMVSCCGVAARALSVLRSAGIDIAMVTTSALDISVLVRAECEDNALQVLKSEFQV